MSRTRIIKRYQNRKLYDTFKSRYVTLDQIGQLLKEGDDIKVIDNKTQRDITAPTLTQIMFEYEKKSENKMPLFMIKDVIRKGEGAILNYITKSISEGIISRYLVKDELEKHFESLVSKNIINNETSNKILKELTSLSNLTDEKPEVFTDGPGVQEEVQEAPTTPFGNL